MSIETCGDESAIVAGNRRRPNWSATEMTTYNSITAAKKIQRAVIAWRR
jgi:hypothetical protein